jgi:hypothetical protein
VQDANEVQVRARRERRQGGSERRFLEVSSLHWLFCADGTSFWMEFKRPSMVSISVTFQSEPKKKKYQRERIHTWSKLPSKLSPDTFQVPPKKCSAKSPQIRRHLSVQLFSCSVQPLWCRSRDRDVYRSNGSKNVTVRYEVYSHFNNQHTKFIRHSQDLTTWSGCTHANTTRASRCNRRGHLRSHG